MKTDFKTVKVKSDTHKRIVKCKSRVEGEDGNLLSFDAMLNILIDFYESSDKF